MSDFTQTFSVLCCSGREKRGYPSVGRERRCVSVPRQNRSTVAAASNPDRSEDQQKGRGSGHRLLGEFAESAQRFVRLLVNPTEGCHFEPLREPNTPLRCC